jgi:hypothetical protein
VLDDLDVALDRLRRVAGEAHDEPGVGDDPGLLPGLEHGPVLGDAVLVLLHVNQVLGIDALEPDEDVLAAGAGRLLDEPWDLVREDIDLDEEVDAVTGLAEVAHAVEDRFPVAVAREIVVGDEEAVDALLPVLDHDALDVVRIAPA